MLAFACAFTMFAGAASFTDESDIQAMDAVSMLTTLGVIEGYEDGSFQPEGTVTRAEMAKMIFVVRNNTADDKAYANVSTSLTDISGHWAEGYIKFCESQGIIAGKGNGIFDPDATVTGTEAAKMLLVLAGYEPKNAGLEGTAWATNTLKHAGAAGILDKVSSGLESGLPRQWAAQMIYNTLSANRVVWSADSNSFDNVLNGGVKETVGRAYMGLYASVGTLVRVDLDALDLANLDRSESDPITTIWNEGQWVGQLAGNFTKVTTDYSDLLGQQVKVLFKDGKTNQVLGVFATQENTVYTVAANETSRDDDKVAFEGTSYRIDFNNNGGINTYIDGNGPFTTTLAQLDDNMLNPNMYTFVDSNGNGRLDTLIVKTYNVAKVSYADSAKIIAAGRTYDYADENIADGIAKDDWVVITRNLFEDKWDIVKADVQTATLDALREKNNENVYFDNVGTRAANYDEYQIGDDWLSGGVFTNGGASAVQGNRSENDLSVVKATQSVDYVAVNGIVFYMAKSTGENTGRVDNVAMVLTKANNGVEDLAKIAFFNGDTATVSVSDKGDFDFDALTPGDVYEYTVVSGSYRFDNLESGTVNEAFEGYYGDLTYRTAANGTALTSAAYNAANDSFDGLKVDDNAQILLFTTTDANRDGTPESAAVADLSGKQFNALNTAGLIVGGTNAYGFSGNMSGLNRIGALALRVNNLDNLNVQTWANYGFILSDAKWIQEYRLAEYDMWDGEQVVTVQEEIARLADRPVRTLIGYDEITTKDGVNTISGAEMLDRTNGMVFTAITDVSNNQRTITAANGGDLDISNSTILYINTEDKLGIADGSVNKADQDTRGLYLANVLYAGRVGDEPDVVVVEQGRWLQSGAYAAMVTGNANTIYGANADTGALGFDTITDAADVDTVAELQDLLDNNTKVTIDIDPTIFDLPGDITIPAGTELEIIGNFDMDGKTITNRGTLDVQGNLNMANGTLDGGTTTVSGLTTIASTLNGTLTTGDLTIGASGKVTAAAKITVNGTLTLTDAVLNNIEVGAQLTLNTAQAVLVDWFYQGTADRAIEITSAAKGTYTMTSVNEEGATSVNGWLIAGDTTTKTLTGSNATLAGIKNALAAGYTTVVVEDAASALSISTSETLALANGQTLEIKGDNDDLTLNTSGAVSVADGATLKVGGDFTLTAVSGDAFVNAGTVEIGGNLDVKASKTFTSNGTTTVAGNVETNTSGDLAGSGSITVNGAQAAKALEVAKDSGLTLVLAQAPTGEVSGSTWYIGSYVVAAAGVIPANTEWQAGSNKLTIKEAPSSITVASISNAALQNLYNAGVTTVAVTSSVADAASIPTGKELVLSGTAAVEDNTITVAGKVTLNTTGTADLSKFAGVQGGQIVVTNVGTITNGTTFTIGGVSVSTNFQMTGKTFTYDTGFFKA